MEKKWNLQNHYSAMDLIHEQKGDGSKGEAPHPLLVLISQTVAGISDYYVVILPPASITF